MSARLARIIAVGLTFAAAFAACHGTIRFDDRSLCASDGDCLLSTLHCDVATGACVACVGDADCTTPGLSRCDTIRGRCVPCSVGADCGSGMVCRSERCYASCGAGVTCPASAPTCDDGFCGQCDDGRGCSAASATPYCSGHSCVACLTDANCGGATPRCDPVALTCVPCATNADCPASTPLCDLGVGQCRAVP
ncbi:MAG TPA: hypothetical protein VHJ20_07850 [Polyangia bacterium]|nr:hypothetical protein [Polyangia bacterium]